MLTLFGLLLGAASAAYLGLRPAGLNFPLPTLDGQLTIRPTFSRVTGYLCGRWAGTLLLGGIWVGLGALLPQASLHRLVFSICALLAFFMFQFLATDSSPEFPLAKLTNPARLAGQPFWLGLLSAGTLLSPVMISMLFLFIQDSLWEGMVFATNIFCGHAVCSLPSLLNLRLTSRAWYQLSLKGLIFFCSLAVLILSVSRFLKT